MLFQYDFTNAKLTAPQIRFFSQIIQKHCASGMTLQPDFAKQVNNTSRLIGLKCQHRQPLTSLS